MEREKINSESCFFKFKNNKLIYRCRKCKEKWEKFNQKVSKYISILQWRFK